MKRAITFFLLISIQCYAFSQQPAKELISKIESLRREMDIPGASIAVINQGKIIWAQGFGYADIVSKRKVNEKTLFQAASITKTLTSAGVLKLLKQHDIALDEPVNRYLSKWKIPANQYTNKVAVTFRLLLNHTAAISNPYPDGGFGPKDTLPTLQEVFLGEKPATNPPLQVTRVPGTVYQYCNGCYAILQGAMEDISNKSYSTLMQELILKPAEMSHSKFDNNFFLKDSSQIAIPYDANLNPYDNAPSRNPIFSTGLLWTNAIDLAKYNLAITQALNEDNNLIQKQLAWDLIIPSYTPIHGLGYFIGDKDGNEKPDGKYIFHSGANVGYLSLSIISKDGQQGAVVLINVSPKWDAKEYPQFKFITDTVKLIANYYQWQ